MRKLVLAAATVAAFLAVGTSQNPVAAMPVASPAALGVTAPDVSGVQQVYWHRGWGWRGGWGWHRPWGYWGWRRPYWGYYGGGPYYGGGYYGPPYGYYGGYYRPWAPCCGYWGWHRRWWW
jgi:hypothetical protein